MSLATTKNLTLLSSLIQGNKAILVQKLDLLNILQNKYGIDQTCQYFVQSCPIVKASIGQHYRHSMDHIELAALITSSSSSSACSYHKNDDKQEVVPLVLRYDLRVRGGTLEKDVNEATKRIHSVIQIFDELQQNINIDSKMDKIYYHYDMNNIVSQKVNASFMLSSDGNEETELESTIGRELGFCAHHAIHHMAMIKIIATQTLGIHEEELPIDFGRAPSTVRFDKNNQ